MESPVGLDIPQGDPQRRRIIAALVAATALLGAIVVVAGGEPDAPKARSEATTGQGDAPAGDTETAASSVEETETCPPSCVTAPTNGTTRGTTTTTNSPSTGKPGSTTTVSTGKPGTPTTATTPTTKPAPVTTNGVTLSQGAIRPGGKLTFSASGFKGGTKVKVELHSDPIVLTTLTANADGTVTSEVTIPANAPASEHHVVATGTDRDGPPSPRPRH